MKTFDQLTGPQQKKAIDFAYKILLDSMDAEIVQFVKTGFDTRMTVHLYDQATEAAEGSKYDDEGNAITEPMEVPYYFQGGCV